MNYQPTDKEVWVQALIFIVYQPMIALKTGRYPISNIINQYPVNERNNIREGIDALIELDLFAMDGNDICITNRSEGFVKGIDYMVKHSADDARDIAKIDPVFASILAAIERDSRLTPPTDGRT